MREGNASTRFPCFRALKGKQMAEANTSEEKTPNYTDEMVETAVQMYHELGNDGLDRSLRQLERTSVRSVLSWSGKVSMWQLPRKPRRRWTVLPRRNCSVTLKLPDSMLLGSKEPLSLR